MLVPSDDHFIAKPSQGTIRRENVLTINCAFFGLGEGHGHAVRHLRSPSTAVHRALRSLCRLSGFGFFLMVAKWGYNGTFSSSSTATLRFVLHVWSDSCYAVHGNPGGCYGLLAAILAGKY